MQKVFENKHGTPIQIFVDRDPEAFMLILSYLRNKNIFEFQNEREALIFKLEAEYWGIELPK
jgi:hypothetical protein